MKIYVQFFFFRNVKTYVRFSFFFWIENSEKKKKRKENLYLNF